MAQSFTGLPHPRHWLTLVLVAIQEEVELSLAHFLLQSCSQEQRSGKCHISPHLKQNFSPHTHETSVAVSQET